MNRKIILIFAIIASIGITSALLNDRPLPNNLPSPDSRSVVTLPNPSGSFNITDLANQYTNENLNILYYKVIVPNDNDTQWNLSVQFAESKPYEILMPIHDNMNVIYVMTTSAANNQGMYAWVCCNISKGDRLFTADATTNDALRGTLTNLYNINYKSRFAYDNNSFRNTLVGASTKPDVYNRRAKLHLDGTQIAYAMETRNVSVEGVPELMKVFLI